MLNSPAARASHSKSTPRTSAAFSGGPGGYAACAAAIHGMSSTIPIARIRNAPLIHGSTAPRHTRSNTAIPARSFGPVPDCAAGRCQAGRRTLWVCVRALHKVSIRSADISRSADTHINFTGGFPVWRGRCLRREIPVSPFRSERRPEYGGQPPRPEPRRVPLGGNRQRAIPLRWRAVSEIWRGTTPARPRQRPLESGPGRGLLPHRAALVGHLVVSLPGGRRMGSANRAGGALPHESRSPRTQAAEKRRARGYRRPRLPEFSGGARAGD